MGGVHQFVKVSAEIRHLFKLYAVRINSDPKSRSANKALYNKIQCLLLEYRDSFPDHRVVVYCIWFGQVIRPEIRFKSKGDPVYGVWEEEVELTMEQRQSRPRLERRERPLDGECWWVAHT